MLHFLFFIHIGWPRYVPDAVAYTDVEDSLPGLIAQRRRWLNGCGGWPGPPAIHGPGSRQARPSDPTCTTHLELGLYWTVALGGMTNGRTRVLDSSPGACRHARSVRPSAIPERSANARRIRSREFDARAGFSGLSRQCSSLLLQDEVQEVAPFRTASRTYASLESIGVFGCTYR